MPFKVFSKPLLEFIILKCIYLLDSVKPLSIIPVIYDVPETSSANFVDPLSENIKFEHDFMRFCPSLSTVIDKSYIEPALRIAKSATANFGVPGNISSFSKSMFSKLISPG
jgi:hypothetical protein